MQGDTYNRAPTIFLYTLLPAFSALSALNNNGTGIKPYKIERKTLDGAVVPYRQHYSAFIKNYRYSLKQAFLTIFHFCTFHHQLEPIAIHNYPLRIGCLFYILAGKGILPSCLYEYHSKRFFQYFKIINSRNKDY